MKLFLLFILTSFQITLSYQDLADFILPYFQNDFIEIEKEYGLQKTLLPFRISNQRNYPGVIYEVKENAPALSIKSGQVEKISNSKTIGDYVIINHGNGIKAKYFHLKDIMCNVGDLVKKGDQIAVSSNRGLTLVNCIGLEIKIEGENKDPEKIIK